MIRRRAARRPTRLGIWGAGVTAGAYAAAATALGWEVAAVTSRSAARSRALARDVGALACTDDEFVRAGLDLACIATPPDDHLRAVRRLGDSGIPAVVCTPLSATLADADALVELDASCDVAMTFGANMAVSPLVAAMLREVRSIGPLTSLVGRSRRRAPDWGGFTDGTWGGGAVLHPGTQLLTPMLLAARLAGGGAPTSVEASYRIGDEVEVAGDVRVAFERGPTMRASISWERDDEHATWDLQASSADDVVRADTDPQPTLERNGEPRRLPGPDVADATRPLADIGLVDLLRLFADDIAADRTPTLPMSLGRDVLEIVTAAARSAGLGGVAVALPFDGDRTATPADTFAAAVRSVR